MSETVYYKDDDGKVRGPFSTSEIKQLVTAGKIAPSTLVGRDRSGEWKEAGRIKGFVSTFKLPTHATEHDAATTSERTTVGRTAYSQEPRDSQPEDATLEGHVSESLAANMVQTQPVAIGQKQTTLWTLNRVTQFSSAAYALWIAAILVVSLVASNIYLIYRVVGGQQTSSATAPNRNDAPIAGQKMDVEKKAPEIQPERIAQLSEADSLPNSRMAIVKKFEQIVEQFTQNVNDSPERVVELKRAKSWTKQKLRAKNISFSVQKSDSLISPIVGTITFDNATLQSENQKPSKDAAENDFDFGKPLDQAYTVRFVFPENQWVLKSLQLAGDDEFSKVFNLPENLSILTEVGSKEVDYWEAALRATGR